MLSKNMDFPKVEVQRRKPNMQRALEIVGLADPRAKTGGQLAPGLRCLARISPRQLCRWLSEMPSTVSFRETWKCTGSLSWESSLSKVFCALLCLVGGLLLAKTTEVHQGSMSDGSTREHWMSLSELGMSASQPCNEDKDGRRARLECLIS